MCIRDRDGSILHMNRLMGFKVGDMGKQGVDFFQAILGKDEAIQNANILIAKSKEIAEKKAGILKLENQIEILHPWLSLDLSLIHI